MNEMQKVSAETLDLVKANLSKAITTGTGLMGYSLEAPSKHLVPFASPLRNRIPRVLSKTGTSVHWKMIKDIQASGKVTTTEGNRGRMINYITEDALAAFKTFGLQDAVTLEAIAAGRNFEDVKAMSVTNLLLKVITEEEKLILGGNTVALANPVQPTLTAAAGGTMPANAALSVKVAALTLIAANQVPLNAQYDAMTLNVTDGITALSPAQTVAVTLNQKVTVSVTPIKGAFAYAVFAGNAGAETLQGVFTTATCVLTKIADGGLAATAVTGNTTADADAFAGLIPQSIAGGAYYLDKNSGKLTKGNGGVDEMDEINSYMFNRYKTGITRWLVSEQSSRDITDAVISGVGAPQLIINNGQQGNLTANYVCNQYINKSYGGQIQALEVHPWLPAGTMVGITESIPYPNANIPAVLEMEMGYDYMQLEYAFNNPQYEYEVRAFGALKHYFPVGCAVIQNIGKGI